MRWIAVFTICLFASAVEAEESIAQETPTMALEAEKTLSRQALSMWAGDAPLETTIFAPGYLNHQEPAADGGVRAIDLATWVAIVEANHRAFPDLSVEILSQLADGDRVASHWRFSATQTGPYEGLSATGKQVSWTGVQIDRFADGKIAESWVVWDKYSLFETLGLLK